MSAPTLTHHTARHAAAHPSGRPAHRRPVTAVAEVALQRPTAPAPLLDCEDGCHYCQGPETD